MMLMWIGRLPLTAADVDITDTTSGMPVWVLLVAIVLSAGGGALGTWATLRRDRSSNEQAMIDQLQEQVRTLTGRVGSLEADLRNMRLRDIAWITYTSDLTRVALEAGASPPAMPTELRTAPAAATAPV